MSGQSDLSLYEIFFEMEINLCETFPALTPFQVRRERATEVFLMLRRMDKYNETEGKKKKGTKQRIRRQANDSWF